MQTTTSTTNSNDIKSSQPNNYEEPVISPASKRRSFKEIINKFETHAVNNVSNNDPSNAEINNNRNSQVLTDSNAKRSSRKSIVIEEDMGNIKREASVAEIKQKFRGNSVPEPMEVFQTKIRHRTLAPFMDVSSQDLRKLDSPKKIAFLNHWSHTVKKEFGENEGTKTDAIEFLAIHGITPEKSDTNTWSEWENAIQSMDSKNVNDTSLPRLLESDQTTTTNYQTPVKGSMNNYTFSETFSSRSTMEISPLSPKGTWAKQTTTTTQVSNQVGNSNTANNSNSASVVNENSNNNSQTSDGKPRNSYWCFCFPCASKDRGSTQSSENSHVSSPMQHQ